MSEKRRTRIEVFQRRAGITPASNARAEILTRMQQLAFELIRLVELERAGIRDGDGQWSGCDPIRGVVAELMRVETADLREWRRDEARKSSSSRSRRNPPAAA